MNTGYEMIGDNVSSMTKAILEAVRNNTIDTPAGIQLQLKAKQTGMDVTKLVNDAKNGISSGIDAITGTSTATNDTTANAAIGENYFLKNKNPAPVSENYNLVTGGHDWLSAKGAFGTTDANGATSTGWVAPAITGALDIGKTIMAYQNLQETKKMNEFNIAAKEEALARQAIDQKNKIAKANINRGIGMGNANSMPVQLVARNPYSVYNTFNPNR